MSIHRIKAKDYEIIASWYKERKLPAPSWQDLSETGYMADNRVAGWLLCTNSSVAIIEHLISNPKTTKQLRRESTDKLVGFMIDTALLLGYTNIVCASKHPAVAQLCKKFGFKKTDLSFYHLADFVENNDYGSYMMDNAIEIEEE